MFNVFRMGFSFCPNWAIPLSDEWVVIGFVELNQYRS